MPDNNYFHWLMDACCKFQNVQDLAILSWGGELLTPEIYEKGQKEAAKAKGWSLGILWKYS